MYRQKLFSAAMATAVVLAGTGAAYAESNDNASEMAALSNAKISLSQAISAAEQKAGGRAIDAGVNNENGVITYGVEIAKGTGLGLALVKAVADLHGMALQLEDARPGLRIVLHLSRTGTARSAI